MNPNTERPLSRKTREQIARSVRDTLPSGPKAITAQTVLDVETGADFTESHPVWGLIMAGIRAARKARERTTSQNKTP